MFEFIKIVILSLVQSITEFLPISSTTHLILVDNFFLRTELTQDSFFITFMQLGSLLALCFYYKKDIVRIFRDTLKIRKEGFIPLLNLINAFIISGILGLVIKKYITQTLVLTAYSLIIGGIMMIILRKKQSRGQIENLWEISPVKAFFIGVAQALSVIPGVSRLGITMIAGIGLNLKKEAAIKFSFLLGIPTMFAASIYELYKNIYHLQKSDLNLTPSIVGFISCFIISIFLIKFLIKFLINCNIKYFGYYRIILATIILLILQ